MRTKINEVGESSTPHELKKSLVLRIFFSRDRIYQMPTHTHHKERATAWSVTINNPIPADEENMSQARQRGWTVEGQLEKGAEGTMHYQLLVKTPQVRFSALKKAFPRAHIEVARNVEALRQYVTKEDTREGDLPTSSEFYPSLQKMWDMFAEWLAEKEIRHKYGYFVDYDSETFLKVFDKFVGVYIQKGYVLETIAVNPQIRSALKHYGINIIFRSIDRQTDRQTDDIILPQYSIPNEGQVQSEASTEESEADEAS
jgi:hypothetical protein